MKHFDIGLLHINIGWFFGEYPVLFKIEILEKMDEFITIFHLQLLGKFIFSLSYGGW